MDPVFIGIDPTAGRRPMSFAVLNDDLDLLQHGSGDLDAVLAVVRPHPSAVVAVDAPQSPNAGLMQQPARRQSYGLPPQSSRWANFKVCEYELRRRGISVTRDLLRADQRGLQALRRDLRAPDRRRDQFGLLGEGAGDAGSRG